MPHEQSLFAALDAPTMREMFSKVPVDTRLRCREVCRAWRNLLDAAPELWWLLDVSQPESGISTRNLSVALLRAVAARTRGAFGFLDVSNCGTLVYDPDARRFNPEFISFLSELEMVLHLVWRNDVVPEFEVLSQLLDAASSAEAVCVDMLVKSFEQACSLAWLEPPYSALCPHYFCVELELSDLQDHDWAVFASLLPNFPSLDLLNLSRVIFHEPEHFNAIVSAVIDMGMSCLILEGTSLDPATAAPALSRLLRLGSVQSLKVRQCPLIRPLLNEASFAAELADALRNDKQLVVLSLGGIGLWNNVTTGNSILAALWNHPRLSCLALCCNRAEQHQARVVSLALLELVANCPGLRELDIRGVFNQLETRLTSSTTSTRLLWPSIPTFNFLRWTRSNTKMPQMSQATRKPMTQSRSWSSWSRTQLRGHKTRGAFLAL